MTLKLESAFYSRSPLRITVSCPQWKPPDHRKVTLGSLRESAVHYLGTLGSYGDRVPGAAGRGPAEARSGFGSWFCPFLCEPGQVTQSRFPPLQCGCEGERIHKGTEPRLGSVGSGVLLSCCMVAPTAVSSLSVGMK